MRRPGCAWKPFLIRMDGTAWAQDSQYGLRFYGTGVNQQDRVRIVIDDNAPGPNASAPCDVGAGSFEPFMTGGAGFIGIVLAMLARGRPVWVLYGALLFGVSLALTTALQVGGFNIPTDVVQMLPFFMVMVVLVAFARHSVLPPALGLPYVRGER